MLPTADEFRKSPASTLENQRFLSNPAASNDRKIKTGGQKDSEELILPRINTDQHRPSGAWNWPLSDFVRGVKTASPVRRTNGSSPARPKGVLGCGHTSRPVPSGTTGTRGAQRIFREAEPVRGCSAMKKVPLRPPRPSVFIVSLRREPDLSEPTRPRSPSTSSRWSAWLRCPRSSSGPCCPR